MRALFEALAPRVFAGRPLLWWAFIVTPLTVCVALSALWTNRGVLRHNLGVAWWNYDVPIVLGAIGAASGAVLLPVVALGVVEAGARDTGRDAAALVVANAPQSSPRFLVEERDGRCYVQRIP